MISFRETIDQRNHIRQRFREARIVSNLTVKEIASILQVSDATITRYETGAIRNIPPIRIKAFEQFGINPNWIYGNSDQMLLGGDDMSQ